MVKFYESYFSYCYSFPAVSLAYFLRYPNPHSRHVLSTDVIDSYVDPSTKRLHTLRLHLKSSKIPQVVLSFIPRGILNSLSNNVGQSYVLEKSVVDAREGWMKTESKNLEWTGVLSVIEKQVYRKRDEASSLPTKLSDNQGDSHPSARADSWTDVQTSVTLHSHLGQGKVWEPRARSASSSASSSPSEDTDPSSTIGGFFSSWSTGSLQRTIEMVGAKRARDQLLKSTEGMKLVLERLHRGGLVSVLDDIRQDREGWSTGHGPWGHAWANGADAEVERGDD